MNNRQLENQFHESGSFEDKLLDLPSDLYQHIPSTEYQSLLAEFNNSINKPAPTSNVNPNDIAVVDETNNDVTTSQKDKRKRQLASASKTYRRKKKLEETVLRENIEKLTKEVEELKNQNALAKIEVENQLNVNALDAYASAGHFLSIFSPPNITSSNTAHVDTPSKKM